MVTQKRNSGLVLIVPEFMWCLQHQAVLGQRPSAGLIREGLSSSVLCVLGEAREPQLLVQILALVCALSIKTVSIVLCWEEGKLHSCLLWSPRA